MHYAVYMRSIYVCVEYILQRIRFGYPTDPDTRSNYEMLKWLLLRGIKMGDPNTRSGTRFGSGIRIELGIRFESGTRIRSGTRPRLTTWVPDTSFRAPAHQ